MNKNEATDKNYGMVKLTLHKFLSRIIDVLKKAALKSVIFVHSKVFKYKCLSWDAVTFYDFLYCYVFFLL